MSKSEVARTIPPCCLALLAFDVDVGGIVSASLRQLVLWLCGGLVVVALVVVALVALVLHINRRPSGPHSPDDGRGPGERFED